MREILFRGVETDREEWVYGYLIHDSVCNSTVPYIGYLSYEQADTKNRDVVPVIPETVGQYTGLIDKNGKKIFEGDIVTILTIEDKNRVVQFDGGGFCLDGLLLRYYRCFGKMAVTVIGNIHDNPELLEVDK